MFRAFTAIVIVSIGQAMAMAQTTTSQEAASQLKHREENGKESHDQSSTRERIERYLRAGTAGVFYSEKEDIRNGAIQRVFIVGTATISTVLGTGEGLEMARERASEVARAEFVSWLGSRVTISKSTEGEVQLVKEGTEEANGNNNRREGVVKIERRTTRFEETASSLVRGLKFVGGEDQPDEKRYVAVYRWDVVNLAAIKKVRNQMNLKTSEQPRSTPLTGSSKKDSLPGRRVIFDD